MKITKKIVAAILAVSMMVFVFAGCSNSKSDDTKKKAKIGIVMLVENGAFTDMKDGIMSKLNDEGYTKENTTFDYQCASGDTTTLSTIVSSMNDGSYDMVFTIATPPTQAFVNLESDTPCFFCAVSAPVQAGIVAEDGTPDKNATGTSNAIPVSDIFGLAKSTTPDIKKWGLIYSGNEDNATNTIEQCKTYLDEAGIKYTVTTASTSSDVETATNALISDGAEAIFVPNDSIIQAGVDSLVQVCNDKKIPTYCSSATTVQSGCFATLAIDDKGIGEKTAEMALKNLNGTAVTDIPFEVVGIDYCSVNKTAMEALGLTEDDIKTDYNINVLE